jgi:threonine-phosphate decarboxylase
VFGIIDEVFVDFCEEESHKHFLVDSEGLLIIRSMTKFYGLPGLRIGYLMTSKALAARLRHFLPPWSVNTYAQVSVPYCLNQEEYREKTREFISHERGRLIKLLQSLEGCQVFPGKANYLLVRLGEHLPPAGKLRQDLLTSDRILIRDCHSFEGLDDHYVRLAIRLPEQNQRLFDAMVRWVKAHAH